MRIIVRLKTGGEDCDIHRYIFALQRDDPTFIETFDTIAQQPDIVAPDRLQPAVVDDRSIAIWWIVRLGADFACGNGRTVQRAQLGCRNDDVVAI
ncbi:MULTISPECIES: hypothetical protein [Sphingobium]|uniref:hypothetical protein n=1 Tax=Sphingobium sp. MI1205 TaxID=407020 RepID=UPI0011A1E21E|nr:hypothetical protein [Sphingobium sp. MI1205]